MSSIASIANGSSIFTFLQEIERTRTKDAVLSITSAASAIALMPYQALVLIVLQNRLIGKKNQNFFDFLSHGVEIRFSNFCMRHFAGVSAIPSQNETSDEIDRVSISDNSTPSGAN